MLSEVANSREGLRDRGSSIYRSSSSPRISALLDNKDKVQFEQGVGEFQAVFSHENSILGINENIFYFLRGLWKYNTCERKQAHW